MHRQRVERERALYREPETLGNICDHLAAGGTLSTFCTKLDIRYTATMAWLAEDDSRRLQYEQALEFRKFHLQDKVLDGVNSIVDQDPRTLFGKDGQPVSVQDIPAGLAPNLTSIKTTPVKHQDGTVSHVVDEVKVISRQVGLEMLAKMCGATGAERVELTGANGGPIAIASIQANLGSLSAEELKALIQIMGKLSAPPPTAKVLSLRKVS